MSRWRTYSPREIEALGRSAPPLTEAVERVCPACGKKAVRRYLYDHDGPRRVAMSYVWCANCRRYASSTGPPLHPDFEFDDPGEKSAELRALRDKDLMALLDHLDALWDSGVLPQTFTPKR
ncbi:hypothetical protein [Amycolatopsis sp. 195334CR]|uniref:hypothetical protein n=1 Tax=Amycolatopsis sp. 195334CR TaxID=2814588 RepID=UPI001A8CED83|nr:hypothetical protein [Amycolatopsis sp. 195334CR]MBN6035333.1 hypothetical protein [Amycolatopsis sp. 195334CR]